MFLILDSKIIRYWAGQSGSVTSLQGFKNEYYRNLEKE
jgi:hypothetical protein